MESPLSVYVKGDILTLNGEDFDFGRLQEGATLPLEAIDSAWFCGPVDRVGGQLVLSLVLPYGLNASENTKNYTGLIDTSDGQILLPAYNEPVIEPEMPVIEPDTQETADVDMPTTGGINE
jgi:hypothetical protein